jgi:cytochrome c5
VQDDEAPTLGGDHGLEVLEHQETGILCSLQALEVEEDATVPAFVEDADGAGEQVGRLGGQMPPSADDSRAAVDDLREGNRFMCHGTPLLGAPGPGIRTETHMRVTPGLCDGAGTTFAVP